MLPTPQLTFQRTPVTLIIAAVAVAIEVVCSLDPERRGYYYNDLQLGIWWQIWEWQWWRPFTTTLLHGGFIHALFNVYWLTIFGPTLEEALGSFRVLGLIVLLAFTSTLPEFLLPGLLGFRESGVVGLSGVIYGLFGMLWVGRRFQPQFGFVCNDSTVRLLVGWFLFCIVITNLGFMPVANIAHGAGLLFGAIFGLASFDLRRRLIWRVVAVCATMTVLATLVGLPGHPVYDQIQRNRRLRRLQSRQVSAPSATGRFEAVTNSNRPTFPDG